MRGSLAILFFFFLGVFLAYQELIPQVLIENDLSLYILCGLMFTVGVNLGYDKKMLATLRKTNFKIMILPIGTIVGTLLGCALMSVFIAKYNVFECMAVGSGFAYYSLSSIFITEYKGEELGTIALVSNIIRELFTFLAAPFLVKYFGKLAPISSGGATSMDTTLPVITRYSGKEFVMVAIFHGLIVDLSVLFLVPTLCHL